MKSNLLILHAANNSHPHLYLFYNKSTKNLLLEHPHVHRGASAGWSSELKAKHWSAFLVNRPNFAISCATMKKNYHVSANENCTELLKVCHYRSFKTKKGNLQGTFWVAENAPLLKIQKTMRQRRLMISEQ